MNPEEHARALGETLELAMRDLDMAHPSDWRSVQDRHRSYDGQPQTDDGERGKTELRGITMRDVKDCFIIGFFLASDVPEDQRGSIYELDFNAIDPIAAQQNMSCELERRMGIYPNVPELRWEDPS